MADTVQIYTVLDTPKEVRVHLIGLSDGTGETSIRKVDKSTLAAAIGGAEAVALDLEYVRAHVYSHRSVRLHWEHTSGNSLMQVFGQGVTIEDYGGRMFPPRDMTSGGALPDPKTSDGSGDVLLTIDGPAANGTYSITLHFSKRRA